MNPSTPSSQGHVSHRLALPAGFELEGCRIEAVLGKGGFGLTYLATDTALNVKVAIKELLPDGIATRVRGATVVAQTEDFTEAWSWALQRFEDEARILAQLRHPNIVRVLRLIKAHGTAYMVMEYVEGQSFAEMIRQRPQLPEASLRALLYPLLDGLEHVHQKRLLHRDISPENIYITREGKPVLLDFGSARQDMGKTVSVTSVVRHGYSPFEQYQVKSHQGPYTDLYALAGVMATAMTGQKPPPATDRISDPTLFPPLVTQCRGRYSETFCNAIESAFAVLPQNRPASIPQFRHILEGATVLMPPPVGVRPPQPPAPLRQGAPLAAWLGGGVFACAASAAIIWWFAVALPERQQRLRAESNATQEEARSRELEHEQQIARLKQQQAQAEADAAAAREAAARAEREKADAQESARLARIQAEAERRRKEADDAMNRRREEEAEAARIAQAKADEERRKAEEAARMEADREKDQVKEVRVAGLHTLVNRYVRSLNSDSAYDYSSLFSSYSYNKYYKGGGQAPRSFVEEDRRKYIKEYPNRTYNLLNDRKYTYEFTSGTMTAAKISFSYQYNVSNSSKRRSGKAHVSLVAEWSGSQWLITSFDESVIRD